MIDIHMTCDGQSLKVTSKPDKIVAGSSGMMRMHVHFAPDWAGFRAYADFDGDCESIIDGVCMVPDSATAKQRFGVRVVGVKGDARTVTERVTIRQEAV